MSPKTELAAPDAELTAAHARKQTFRDERDVLERRRVELRTLPVFTAADDSITAAAQQYLDGGMAGVATMPDIASEIAEIDAQREIVERAIGLQAERCAEIKATRDRLYNELQEPNMRAAVQAFANALGAVSVSADGLLAILREFSEAGVTIDRQRFGVIGDFTNLVTHNRHSQVNALLAAIASKYGIRPAKR